MSYHHRRKHHNRLGNTEFLQRIILYFLIGFFCGAVFYYLFQNSFEGVKEQLEANVRKWSVADATLLSLLWQSIWSHGKYFVLLWILSVSRISGGYQKVFTLYTGIRNGFLILFFLYARGAYGILVYLASLFPHTLLFVPLYLFSFAVIQEKRQIKHKVMFGTALFLVFFTACLVEVKGNLPIMEAVLG